MAHVDFSSGTSYDKNAAHAIGMDRRDPYIRHGKMFYKPYRNGYYTHPGCSDWKCWMVMVNAGYAKREGKPGSGGSCFHLTRAGLDWLGKQLNMYIHDEEK